jgi:hypothetical protein
MVIIFHKSTLSFTGMEAALKAHYKQIFPFMTIDFSEGIKYLGFHLKPNDYRKYHWCWLLAKFEKYLKGWRFRWLSKAGKLTLAKLVLESILVYWMSLS